MLTRSQKIFIAETSSSFSQRDPKINRYGQSLVAATKLNELFTAVTFGNDTLN
jgi:hypothetical protein